MSDMSKPQYLIQDNKGWKLRRAVPKELRELAGKASFVERVGRVSQKDAYEKARLFGVETDIEFKKLRSQLASATVSGEKPKFEPRFKFTLDPKIAAEIASAYFLEREEQYNRTRAISSEHSREDALLDAQKDLASAEATMDGQTTEINEMPYTATHAQALKQLVKYGHLPETKTYKSKKLSRSTRRLMMPDEITSTSEFEYLCNLLERAEVELASRRLERLEIGGTPSVKDKFFEPMLMSGADPHPYFNQGKGHTLQELIDAFIAEKKQQIGASRLSDFSIPIRFLVEHFGGDCFIEQIDRAKCDEFVELLPRIPPHVTQHYKKTPIKAAIKQYEKKEGQPAYNTRPARKKLDVVKAIFSLAYDKEWLNKNPFGRLNIVVKNRNEKKHEKKENGYSSFELADLIKIFSAPIFTGCVDDGNGFNRAGQYIIRKERYWTPIISLFSGMRLNEILQLEKADICEIENIWCFCVTDKTSETDGFKKHLKNINAYRTIPIHSELIKFGFLDWVKARDKGRLFPNADADKNGKLSTKFSKKFNTFLKSRDVWKPRKKVFHSFRNSSNDALRNGGVSVEYREAIHGWQGRHSQDKEYGDGYSPSILQTEINKATFEGLDLDHLKPENWKKTRREK